MITEALTKPQQIPIWCIAIKRAEDGFIIFGVEKRKRKERVLDKKMSEVETEVMCDHTQNRNPSF